MFKQNLGVDEVVCARSKLDGVLKTLVDKKEDIAGSAESAGEDEEIPEFESPFKENVGLSPSKRNSSASKASRKKRKLREEVTEEDPGLYHHTYVMKLFDRSVDLAQFDENAPLYPVCRAWMRNDPKSNGSKSLNTTQAFDEEQAGVYELPAPIKVKAEDGNTEQYSRIPSLIPHDDSDSLDIYKEPTESVESLQTRHMARWKAIRQTWKEAAKRRESLYAPSLNKLREMFDSV